MLFVVLCPGTPEGSTGSGSGFKASQKTGQRLKVSSDRLVLDCFDFRSLPSFLLLAYFQINISKNSRLVGFNFCPLVNRLL